MTGEAQPRVIRRADLKRQPGRVIDEGGDLRVLDGSDHGLRTSVMHSEIAAGSGPRPHRHPHAEIFVVEAGQVRFEVDGASVDAEAGDMVIIPIDALHTFTNTGSGTLHVTAIHENARAVTVFADGTRRG